MDSVDSQRYQQIVSEPIEGLETPLSILFVITAIIGQAEFVPQMAGYILTASIGSLGLCLALLSPREISMPVSALSMFAGLIAILIGHLIFTPTMELLLRGGAFAVFGTIILLILAPRVDRSQFFTGIGVVAAAIVLIGLPQLWLGVISIGPILYTPWQGISMFGTPALSSILENPNTLGIIAMFGTLGLIPALKSRPILFPLPLLTGSGVVLSSSRSALLCLCIGILIIASIVYGSQRVGAIVAIGSVFGTLLFTFLALGLIPFPIDLPIGLSGRGLRWQSTLRATMARPIFGWGPVDLDGIVGSYFPDGNAAPHNSYLKVAVTTGFSGGILYLLLSLFAINNVIKRNTSTIVAAVVVAWVIVTMILQLFEGSSLFGLSPVSILFAFAYGFGLNDCGEGMIR